MNVCKVASRIRLPCHPIYLPCSLLLSDCKFEFIVSATTTSLSRYGNIICMLRQHHLRATATSFACYDNSVTKLK